MLILRTFVLLSLELSQGALFPWPVSPFRRWLPRHVESHVRSRCSRERSFGGARRYCRKREVVRALGYAKTSGA
ncbi:hypothetical protein EDD85DRAFT_104172 [Armillaria nabsnona]|nr:hypothetical protein EDD85DRAFT_104172 [Armillaria nabsnona]